MSSFSIQWNQTASNNYSFQIDKIGRSQNKEVEQANRELDKDQSQILADPRTLNAGISSPSQSVGGLTYLNLPVFPMPTLYPWLLLYRLYNSLLPTPNMSDATLVAAI